MTLGDVLSLGGVDTVLLPVSDEETTRRKKTSQRPVSPWGSLILLTGFQVLTALQFLFSTGEEHVLLVPAAFLCLWPGDVALLCLTLRCLGRIGFEMETIAFFLSTLSLAVTASSAPSSVPKQLLAVFLGIILFLVVGIFLRDLDRVRKIRWLMAAGAVALLSLSLVAGPRAVRGPPTGSACWASPSALGAGQDLLHLRRGGHPGAAVPQAESGAVHPAHRGLHGLPGPDERLRHRRHLLCHLPGHRLPALRGLHHPWPSSAGGRCSGGWCW